MKVRGNSGSAGALARIEREARKLPFWAEEGKPYR